VDLYPELSVFVEQAEKDFCGDNRYFPLFLEVTDMNYYIIWKSPYKLSYKMSTAIILVINLFAFKTITAQISAHYLDIWKSYLIYPVMFKINISIYRYRQTIVEKHRVVSFALLEGLGFQFRCDLCTHAEM